MSLLRTSLLNGIVVAVRIGSALALNKIFAVLVGPSGYAAIGQFQNAVTVAISLSSAGISSGVTRETAAFADNPRKQIGIWRTAFTIATILSAVIGAAIGLFSSSLASWLLDSPDSSYVFICLAFLLPAIISNNILLAIINGKKDVSLYVKANILGSVVVLILAATLTLAFGLNGGLTAFAVSPAVALVGTVFMLRKKAWFKYSSLFGKSDRNARTQLLRFGMMGLAGAVSMPLASILIRQHITETLGLEAAGYWQAVWRISEVYLMLITTTLSLYFLPRLGEISLAGELKAEIRRLYVFVIPVVVGSALLIFLLRDFIIHILFTQDFLPIRDLFFWQLVGDALKIGSWVLGYVLLGRTMVKAYVFAELIFSASFFGLVVWLVGPFGLQGVAVAYTVNYFFYWIYVAVMTRREIHRMALVKPAVARSGAAE
ncbi:O-antigen translocase [Arthrobacter alkaliphilus]|uniref:O-antigen translocase n=1 Tax=Arthrobacter alkaliphilus TaxID=369936 RepID=UPI001F2C0942|nr:O-antigen translocase [Arthrobacter alkaliphilus]